MATLTVLGPNSSAAPPDPTDGTLVVRFPPQSQDIIVYRIAISGPPQTIAKAYIGTVSPATLIDVSYFGQADSAEFPAGFLLPAGQSLVIAWYSIAPPATLAAPNPITTGAASLATATVTFDYET